MTGNVYERLTEELDAVERRLDRSNSGVTTPMWFHLAIVAVHALIMIASAMWDKGEAK